MREHPIPFIAPMVRSILESRKTQTRRVVTHPVLEDLPEIVDQGDGWWGDDERRFRARCPYGQPGDRLWVRETARVLSVHSDIVRVRFEADGAQANVPFPPRLKPVEPGRCIANGCHREAARILLEIADVRVERLNDISEADCVAEGCAGGHGSIPGYGYAATPIEHYRHLWEALAGPGSWAENPWVWVISFRRIEEAPTRPDRKERS